MITLAGAVVLIPAPAHAAVLFSNNVEQPTYDVMNHEVIGRLALDRALGLSHDPPDESHQAQPSADFFRIDATSSLAGRS